MVQEQGQAERLERLERLRLARPAERRRDLLARRVLQNPAPEAVSRLAAPSAEALLGLLAPLRQAPLGWEAVTAGPVLRELPELVVVPRVARALRRRGSALRRRL